MKFAAFAGRGAFAKRLISIVLALTALGWLSACNFDIGGSQDYPEQTHQAGKGNYDPNGGTLFGKGSIFSNNTADAPDNGASGGVGVNSLLWRASLDTISFMPLVSADPFGGVIITDWYTPPSTPNERFKVNIYILGRALRADGIRASVFRQTNDTGTWADAPVALNTSTDLENAILTRARQLRMSGVQQ
ncbi:MAG TPA: DUF3576 domain-containing protein [Acidobacteriaceae bacterium]|jgi:hypothetical protein|nr:DUF3576 domain-containing protein [Acidobacteriaceae bacterium]